MKSGLWLITLGCFTLFPLPSYAQIIPDNSLGAENSQINPNATINGNSATQIEGGATRGSNLFHSFQDFNVNLGQQVYFANPADIANIFTRVTGNNPSNILGTLGVEGAANLFLLNPNGIIFGENAQLDIRGSFVASTADSLLFNNGIEFSATNPQAPPLLTVNVPLGLQRGNSNATITNRGNLSVGGNFTLDATNLNLQGKLHAGGNLALQATDTVTIRDTESNPFLATAYGSLVVQGNQAVDIFALNHADSGFYSYGDMTFRSDNPVGGDAHYWSGGNFRIERLDGSLGDLYSPYDPVVRSQGDVLLNAYRGTSLHILAAGRVRIADAEITGADTTGNTISPTNPLTSRFASVTLSNGSQQIIDGTTQPILDVRAGVNPAIIGSPLGTTGTNYTNINGFAFPTITNADIDIGNVEVSAPNGLVFLSNNYHANKNLEGDINLFNRGEIELSNNIGHGSSAIFDSRHNININGDINTQSTIGNSGDITLIADNNITITNESRLRTTSQNNRNAGNITIIANQFVLNGGAGLYANTNSTGNGGRITVNASDSVNINQGFIFVNTVSNTGNAGNIIINTSQLDIQNGSLLNASSQGTGSGGYINFNVPNGIVNLVGNDSVTLSSNRKISPTTLALGSFNGGSGGTLIIEARQLLIQNGALVYGSASTNSGGNAANITVRASEFVQVIGTTPNNQLQSSISSDTFGAGNAGNLQIFTPTLSVLDGGKISAGTTGTGRAGTLSVNDANMVEVRGTSANGQLISTIVYDSFGAGDAGELTINSQGVIVQNGGRISARTGGLGRGGAINVNAPDALEISGRSPNGQASGLFFNSEGSGDARGINVTTGVLRLSDGGQMNVGGAGAGTAGDIKVKATSIFMNNGSRITAETSANGGGGNIRLEVADLIWLRNDSDIRTDARGAGLGGNIDITAEAVLAILSENSDVIARSELNQGGRITVNAKLVTNFRLYQGIDTPESDLTANSVFGIDGIVDLFTSDLQLEPGLPESPRDVQIRQNCQANREVNTPAVAIAELYIMGRGGMSPNPSNPLSSGGMSVPFAQSFASVTGENSNAMVEAGGLVRLPNGEVILASSELLGEIDLSLACTQR